MARTGLRALALALVAALCAPLGFGADDPDKRFDHQLAVQAAFEQGLAHLKRQDYQAAVRTLEKQIAYIDGNARYLEALRDAYRGHVRELRKAGKGKDAELYRRRLAILEPTTEVITPAALNPPTKDDLPPRPAAVAAATKAPEVVGRGKVREEEARDPFAEGNRAVAIDGRDLVERAEKAFTDKQFDRACTLYEQASTAGAALASASRDRWAYCKLV